MRKAILILTSLLITSLGVTQSQNVFKKYGFKKEVLTLSKGKYQEIFKNEEVVQIGTVLVNTKTNKVVKLLNEDTTKTAYNAELSSRFLTIDPLCEKYPEISPYAFCSNNPINRVDPNGLDDYMVNRSGHFTLIRKTDDAQDRLIAVNKSGKIEVDKKGNLKNTMMVDKGILDQKNHQEFMQNDNLYSGKVERDFYEIKTQTNVESKNLFKFLANNTDVEWNLSLGNDKKENTFNLLVTSHDKETVDVNKLIKWENSTKGISFTADYHNHPSGNFHPSGESGDIGFAKTMLKLFPTMTFFIYTRQDGKMHQFNTKSK